MNLSLPWIIVNTNKNHRLLKIDFNESSLYYHFNDFAKSVFFIIYLFYQCIVKKVLPWSQLFEFDNYHTF